MNNQSHRSVKRFVQWSYSFHFFRKFLVWFFCSKNDVECSPQGAANLQINESGTLPKLLQSVPSKSFKICFSRNRYTKVRCVRFCLVYPIMFRSRKRFYVNNQKVSGLCNICALFVFRSNNCRGRRHFVFDTLLAQYSVFFFMDSNIFNKLQRTCFDLGHQDILEIQLTTIVYF